MECEACGELTTEIPELLLSTYIHTFIKSENYFGDGFREFSLNYQVWHFRNLMVVL